MESGEIGKFVLVLLGGAGIVLLLYAARFFAKSDNEQFVVDDYRDENEEDKGENVTQNSMGLSNYKQSGRLKKGLASLDFKSVVIWFASLLILGFLLPFYVDGEFHHLLELFDEDEFSAALKLMIIYPLLAGIALLIVANTVQGIGRAVTVLSIGIFPVLLLMIDEDISEFISEVFSQMPIEAMAAILGIVGMVGFFTVGRAGSVVPRSASIPIISGIATGAYLLSLFTKVEMPAGDDTIALLAPLKLLSIGDELPSYMDDMSGVFAVQGLLGFAAIVLLIFAAVLCIRLIIDQKKRVAFCDHVLVLVSAAFGINVLSSFIMPLWFAIESEDGEVFFAVFLVMLKVVCLVWGLLLLIPFGSAELVIACADPAAAQEPAAGSSGRVKDRMAELNSLREDGLISSEEFESKKAELLSQL